MHFRFATTFPMKALVQADPGGRLPATAEKRFPISELHISLVVCLLLVGTTLPAAEIHVAGGGNDQAGDGSEARPFQTINHAFDVANGNREADTIYLRRGDTFHEILHRPAPRARRPGDKPTPDSVTFKPYGPGTEPPHWKSTGDNILEVGLLRFVAEGIRFTGKRGLYPLAPDCVVRDCILDTESKITAWMKNACGLTVTNCVLGGASNIALHPRRGLLYSFDIPAEGWYRLTTQGHPWHTTYRVSLSNDERFFGDSSRLFRLAKGPLEVRVDGALIADLKRCTVEPADTPDPHEAATLRRTSPYWFLRPGEPVRVTLSAASDTVVPAAVVLTRHADGAEIDRRRLTIHPGATREQSCEFRVEEEGQFNITALVDGQPASSEPVRFVVMNPTPLPAPDRYEPPGEGALVDEIDCAEDPQASGRLYYDSGDARVVDSPLGRYREGGAGTLGGQSHSNAARSWFGYQIHFENLHRPHRVVVDYPDDDFRAFLLVIYEQGRAMRQFDNGVGTGGPRRLSRRVHRREIFLWPRHHDAWLVAHTWRKNAPAAIQRIRVYEMEDGLPPLPVGNSGRYFGMYYEEPRFIDWSHQVSDEPIEFVRTWDRLGSFMRHTGQNLLWYQGISYGIASTETELVTTLRRFGPRSDHFGNNTFRGMLLSAEKHGYGIIADLHEQLAVFEEHLPEGVPIVDTRQTGADGTMATFAPSGDSGYNIVHPAVQDLLLRAFRQVAEKYRDSPAFLGLSFRTMQVINPAYSGFGSERFGYGDFTVGLFEKETGVEVPGGNDPGDPERFRQRYEHLMGPKRAEWIAWRTRKVTDWLSRVAGMLREVRPDLQLFMSPKGGGFQRVPARGMDPGQWAEVPNLRFGTATFIGYHFAGYRMPMSHTQDIRPWDRVKDRYAHMGRHTVALCPNPYMEGGELWKIYPSEMQRHIGPGGDSCGAPDSPPPYYIERVADLMSTGPLWMFADGALAYRGILPRQKQKIARFVRSLPMADFRHSGINLEPAFLWEADHEGERIFYVVNRQVYPVALDLAVEGADQARRLHDGKTVLVVRDALRLELEPFGMEAYAVAGGSRIVDGTVEVPPEEVARLREMIRQGREIVDAALARRQEDGKTPDLKTEDFGLDAYAQAPLEIAAAEKALAERRYDTAERLVRGSYAFDAPDERGFTLPMVYAAMDRWPEGAWNASER